MPRLWKYFGREPFLVNPHLVVANPRKRRYRLKHDAEGKARKRLRAGRKTQISGNRGRYEVNMRRARDSKGRFLKAGARRQRRRRNTPIAANPRRRRHTRRAARRNFYAGNPRRRHVARRRYRRHNPAGTVSLSFLGIDFPDLQTIGFTAGGFVVPPFIEGFAQRFLPAALTSNLFGKYLIKIGAVAVNALAVNQFVGKREAKLVTLGGTVYLAASLLTDFAPTMIGAAAGGKAGYYNTGALGSQPLVGEYTPMGEYSGAGAYQDGVPERLRPANRY